MPLLRKIKETLLPTRRAETEPAAAYDIWAQYYDDQPDNLMLALDEQICRDFMQRVPIAGRAIADIGCGTGRHWPAILAQQPARLVGYDVSAGMLDILRKKYPQAETHQLESGLLTTSPAGSIDVVISTLTVAHIPDLAAAITEWCRVLQPGGEMIITDYHPEALARGGQRTFRDGDRVIAVRNYIYPIRKVRAIATRLGLQELSFTEKKNRCNHAALLRKAACAGNLPTIRGGADHLRYSPKKVRCG